MQKMVEWLGYVLVGLIIACFGYALFLEIKSIQDLRLDKTTVHEYKRTIIGHYLTCFALAGFLISYVLNVLVALEFFETAGLTSDNTGFSCTIFIVLLFVIRFGVLPKQANQGVR